MKKMSNENIKAQHASSPFRGPGGILIIDNYDSFTYNLVHLVNEIGLQCEVWRNDKFNISDVDAYDRIILSPGPGIPSEAGLLMEVIEKYAPTKSIFGVFLGQQAIAEVYAPPLSPITVLLRKWKKDGRTITGKTVGEAAAAIKAGEDPGGDDKPLNATGLLIASMHNAVNATGAEFSV